MQKWEYAEAVVTMPKFPLDMSREMMVLYFKTDRTDVETIPPDERVEVWDNFNKKLAQLGIDGWEIFSTYLTDSPRQFLYMMKRPIETR